LEIHFSSWIYSYFFFYQNQIFIKKRNLQEKNWIDKFILLFSKHENPLKVYFWASLLLIRRMLSTEVVFIKDLQKFELKAFHGSSTSLVFLRRSQKQNGKHLQYHCFSRGCIKYYKLAHSSLWFPKNHPFLCVFMLWSRPGFFKSKQIICSSEVCVRYKTLNKCNPIFVQKNGLTYFWRAKYKQQIVCRTFTFMYHCFSLFCYLWIRNVIVPMWTNVTWFGFMLPWTKFWPNRSGQMCPQTLSSWPSKLN